MNPRLQWDVGRGETSACEEREGDSRSQSRPGVQLRIDQNATGDESEATPSSSQQGSKRSREDDHRVGDNRAAEAPRKSMGSMLFSPWDTWIQQHQNRFFLQIWCVPWDVGLIAEGKRQVDAMTVEEYQSKPTATPRATTIIDSREVHFELHDHKGLLPLPSPKIDEVLPGETGCAEF